jgi:beta-phosphoglucomutase-like phosphatase (HAD superfamily)
MDIIAKKIGAIIFDMDGTIVQSNQTWSMKIVRVLLKRGIPQEDIDKNIQELDVKLTGLDAGLCAKYLKKMFKITDTYSKLRRDLLSPFDSQIPTTLEYISGFQDFHKKLQFHKIPSCIATNSHRPYFSKIQEIMGLPAFFGEHLYCVEDVDRKGKPSPDLFLFAAKKLGVPPQQCLVFEDSKYGFLAAQAAGMKCIAINVSSREIVHGCIDSYDEAIDAMKQILL